MNKEKHNQVKKILKIVGIVLLVIGIAMVAVGVVDFTTFFVDGKGPVLFFLIFIGAPIIFVGSTLMTFGFKREIGTYLKDEVVPVINESADDLHPAIKSVTRAVRDGLRGNDAHTVTCPKCGVANPAGHSFCPECGEPLVKTCPKCGTPQEADDKFCGKCGARFE